SAAHVEVRYDDIQKHVGVHTYTPSTGWQQRGSYIAATYVSGDQLGARARADGTLQVFKNGVSIGQVSLGSWAYAGAGGRIGLTLDGTLGARLDNFGGGSTVTGPPSGPATAALAEPLYESAELPDRLAISGASPNPSSGQVAFGLALPAPAAVELSIYDLQGRLIWSDESRQYAAGRKNLTWSGSSDRGRAPTGIYLARIAVDGRGYMRRFALLR
ncbi:MAG TPA: T9SS type A sorting domain-containing protein, partial [Candidatus Limnocylindria bacterium]|nr:T9SS type A sorting domain-containing protein [Candidatus Limnocylindria bacterium]